MPTRAPRRTPSRPWRRRKSATTDPATVYDELQRRTFTDLEDCRLAWERAGDPLALCVAVTKADMPQWLADALLLVLTDDTDMHPPFVRLRRRWAVRGREAIDSWHATGVAAARTHHDLPQTWERSYLAAERLVRRVAAVPKVSEHAVKKSYQRVRRGLSNPGRYYRAPGFSDRLDQTMGRLRVRIEADLAQREQKAPARK